MRGEEMITPHVAEIREGSSEDYQTNILAMGAKYNGRVKMRHHQEKKRTEWLAIFTHSALTSSKKLAVFVTSTVR